MKVKIFLCGLCVFAGNFLPQSRRDRRVFKTQRPSTTASIIAFMLAAAFAISCSQAENKNVTANTTVAPSQTAATTVSSAALPAATPVASVSGGAAPPVSSGRNLPPEGGDKPTAGDVQGYSYSYTKDGEKTVATFGPNLLPADRDIIVDAMRDVIYRSYGDKVDSAPRVEGKGPERSIHITGNKHEYVVVIGRDVPDGPIHLLIITQQTDRKG